MTGINLRMRNVSGESCRENRNTHFVVNNSFENFGIYVIMWKSIIEWGRPQTTVWGMHSAYWMSKATHKHSDCVILIAFPLLQWLHESALMLCYMYTACLVYFKARN